MHLEFGFDSRSTANLFHNSSAVESVTVNHLVPGSNPGCGVGSDPAGSPKSTPSPYAVGSLVVRTGR